MADALLICASIGETRAAVIEDGRPVGVDHHRDGTVPAVESVWRARVTRVMPEHDLAHLALTDGVPAVLPFRRARPLTDKARPRGIADCVSEGQQVVVQVTREGEPGKAAIASATVRLAGRYVVAAPDGQGLAFADRLAATADRDGLTDALSPLADTAHLTVRRAAAAVPPAAVAAEAGTLIEDWTGRPDTPGLVRPAPAPVARLLRDSPPAGTDRVIVDDPALTAEAERLAAGRWPDLDGRVERWRDREPLFDAFGVDDAIDRAIADRIPLPGGGWIAIDETRALTAIDVDAGSGAALTANLEAADEIARQLRFQGIGGLIVVDFIDMKSKAARQRLTKRLDGALADDPRGVRRSGPSPFGLVELNRPRVGPSLRQRLLNRPPPHPSAETAALALLRRAEREARADRRPGAVVLVADPATADLLGDRPGWTDALAARIGRRVRIDVDAGLDIGGGTAHIEPARHPGRP